jgi:hypothetical protein
LRCSLSYESIFGKYIDREDVFGELEGNGESAAVAAVAAPARVTMTSVLAMRFMAIPFLRLMHAIFPAFHPGEACDVARVAGVFQLRDQDNGDVVSS